MGNSGQASPDRLLTILGPPAIVAVTVCGWYLLPIEVIIGLSAWVLTSFPIGMLIGHCILNEDR